MKITNWAEPEEDEPQLVEIEIIFQDGEKVTVSDVYLHETPISIEIYRDEARRNVVPLPHNVKQYEIRTIY